MMYNHMSMYNVTHANIMPTTKKAKRTQFVYKTRPNREPIPKLDHIRSNNKQTNPRNSERRIEDYHV